MHYRLWVWRGRMRTMGRISRPHAFFPAPFFFLISLFLSATYFSLSSHAITPLSSTIPIPSPPSLLWWLRWRWREQASGGRLARERCHRAQRWWRRARGRQIRWRHPWEGWWWRWWHARWWARGDGKLVFSAKKKLNFFFTKITFCNRPAFALVCKNTIFTCVLLYPHAKIHSCL